MSKLLMIETVNCIWILDRRASAPRVTGDPYYIGDGGVFAPAIELQEATIDGSESRGTDEWEGKACDADHYQTLEVRQGEVHEREGLRGNPPVSNFLASSYLRVTQDS